MEIRAATADDYDAYARLVPELRVDDPIPSRGRFVDELRARTLVAVQEEAVVGYALLEVLAEVGYVRNLVTDPARRRQGVGAALMTAARERLLAAGARAWCLNVKPDNAPALALYRRFGFEAAWRSYVLRVPRAAPFAEAAPGLTLLPVAPDDDEAVETTTGLLRGQLASARAKEGRLVRQLRRGDEIVGVAVFSPAIPGAFPFRVVEPALGPALLEALRPLAPAEAPHVQAVVEGDEALRDALLAHGARLHLEILHLRGALVRGS